jgi:hypothetical protein
MKVDLKSVWNGPEVKIQGHKVVNKSAYETGLVIERLAKLLAAVNWGYLAASITTQAADGTGTEVENPASFQKETPYGKPPNLSTFEMTIEAPKNENEVYVGTPVEYANYVEYGTFRMNAQPFLRPAMDLAMGKTLTILEDNAGKYFGDYLRRPE